jgi:predicted hydrocarbon binding protein
MHAIDSSHAVVLVASNAINGSDHVLNELDIIVAKKKFFIPFFIEEFEMNDDYRYYLGRTQRIIAYPGDPASFFGKLFEAILPLLPLQETPKPAPAFAKEASVAPNPTKVFECIPERGIMINPEDHQRNVSFRTDTFISMFSGIYDGVVDIVGSERAAEILYATGFQCGQAFAARLNSQWELSSGRMMTVADKLKKWCEFDSDVGWGKFTVAVEIDEEEGRFRAELAINECFIVDRKGKRPVCGFVKGYCAGVIETLIGAPVVLQCSSCPMKSLFKSACRFEVTLQED